MSDDRSPDQIAADDALTAAVEAINAAYYPDDDPRILTDYLVVYVQQSFDEDGNATVAIGAHPRDGDLPLYRQIGMLDHTLTRARHRVADSEAL
ncbi:MAG: hypothetical protein JWM02_3684 [Frankiales bacterium]|nr:hypothetical protein [Frankiales bacterium]